MRERPTSTDLVAARTRMKAKPRKPPVLRAAPGTHRVVRELFDEMTAQQATIAQVAQRSGVNRDTFKDWRSGRRDPLLSNIEAAANVLGFEIVMRPRRYALRGDGE